MKMVEDREDLYWEKKFEKPSSGRSEGKQIMSNKITVVLRMIEKL